MNKYILIGFFYVFVDLSPTEFSCNTYRKILHGIMIVKSQDEYKNYFFFQVVIFFSKICWRILIMQCCYMYFEYPWLICTLATFAPVIKTHLYHCTRGRMANADCHFHYIHKRVSLVSFPSFYRWTSTTNVSLLRLSLLEM